MFSGDATVMASCPVANLRRLTASGESDTTADNVAVKFVWRRFCHDSAKAFAINCGRGGEGGYRCF